jgi:hypothetical protein
MNYLATCSSASWGIVLHLAFPPSPRRDPLLILFLWLFSAMPALIPVDNTLGSLFIGTVLSSMCVSLSINAIGGSD